LDEEVFVLNGLMNTRIVRTSHSAAPAGGRGGSPAVIFLRGLGDAGGEPALNHPAAPQLADKVFSEILIRFLKA
jgi:hypothetical protein